MCAGGIAGRDTCAGDSGGPLMRPLKGTDMKFNWYCVGVVSYGRGCGIDKWSGVYTRVSSYMDWIVANMKA